jgi:flavorubredoxin
MDIKITNRESGTNVAEVADGIYRISTPLPEAVVGIPGGFTFNQYLVVDDDPLLFHTGPRKSFPLTREAVAAVMPVERLRWISFSHYESDECGAVNEWLATAPGATVLCGRIGAMVTLNDVCDRPPRALGDGEEVSLGRRRVMWLDAPHLPHNWECGYLWEPTTRTLLCGDVVSAPGANGPPVTDGDLLGPVLAMEEQMHVFARTPDTRRHLERMAGLEPVTLAAMHGSAYRGDGARWLRALADGLGV